MKKKPLRIVTCCLAGALLTAVPVYDVEASTSAGISEYASTVIDSELNNSSPVAGISLAVRGYLEENAAAMSAASKKDAETSEAASDKKEDEQKEKKSEKEEEKKSSKYDDMAVAQVDDYVNIRKKPSEDAELVGKLYKNAVATVLKKKGDWYKIESGSVTGYVKGDYIAVGDEDLIKSAGVQVATVSTTTLKVRSKASEKSDVLTLVPGGEELAVTDMKQYEDGWVKVKVDGGKGYVSSDYVELSRQYTYAESKAEEDARLALEEARRAEEEAAARREQEAQNAAAAGAGTAAGTSGTSTGSASTGSGSSTSSSGSSGSTSSSSSGSSSGSSAGSSVSAGSTSSSRSGQAVVSYASQFIGRPYVYGGSSLTNGTDCSGFVMSVYAHFGVSLPHSSSALRGVGYGVSAGSMQPGDIVCYSGHVGIYVGGNTIIHASNPASGIKYTSPANYRPIVAVRRIF